MTSDELHELHELPPQAQRTKDWLLERRRKAELKTDIHTNPPLSKWMAATPSPCVSAWRHDPA
jgi:hypothetical protein